MRKGSLSGVMVRRLPSAVTISTARSWFDRLAHGRLLPWVPVAIAPPMVWYTNLCVGEGGKVGYGRVVWEGQAGPLQAAAMGAGCDSALVHAQELWQEVRQARQGLVGLPYC